MCLSRAAGSRAHDSSEGLCVEWQASVAIYHPSPLVCIIAGKRSTATAFISFDQGELGCQTARCAVVVFSVLGALTEAALTSKRKRRQNIVVRLEVEVPCVSASPTTAGPLTTRSSRSWASTSPRLTSRRCVWTCCGCGLCSSPVVSNRSQRERETEPRDLNNDDFTSIFHEKLSW